MDIEIDQNNTAPRPKKVYANTGLTRQERAFVRRALYEERRVMVEAIAEVKRVAKDAIDEIKRTYRTTRSNGAPRPGGAVVYFVLMRDMVKIGTTCNIGERMRALENIHPDKLTLIGAIPGSFQEEATLHKRFSEYRRHGEWFHYSGELKQYIDALPGVMICQP